MQLLRNCGLLCCCASEVPVCTHVDMKCKDLRPVKCQEVFSGSFLTSPNSRRMTSGWACCTWSYKLQLKTAGGTRSCFEEVLRALWQMWPGLGLPYFEYNLLICRAHGPGKPDQLILRLISHFVSFWWHILLQIELPIFFNIPGGRDRMIGFLL